METSPSASHVIEEHFINAVYDNDQTVAEEIAEFDNFINLQYDGETALLVAIKEGHKEIFNMLLTKPQLDVNQLTVSFEDAQLISRTENSEWTSESTSDMESQLLSTGTCSINSLLELLAVNSIIMNGCKVLANAQLYTKMQGALVYAITLHRKAETTEERTFYMRRLLERGADVDSISLNGCTVLFECCRYGFMDGVEILIEFGANPKMPSPTGLLPIDVAAQSRSVELIDLVVNYTYGVWGPFPLKLATLVELLTYHWEYLETKILPRVSQLEILDAGPVQRFVETLDLVPFEVFQRVVGQFPIIMNYVHALEDFSME